MKHADEYQVMRNLEVGDDVDDDTIKAFNTLIHGPRHVKHQGRPRDGDRVLNSHCHSLIIIREVLILTLAIFNAL